MDKLNKLVARVITESKVIGSAPLDAQVRYLNTELSKIINKIAKFQDVSSEFEDKSMWVSCSECASTILISKEGCTYCGHKTLDSDTKDVPDKKEAPKKATKKVVKKVVVESKPEPKKEVVEEAPKAKPKKEKVADTPEPEDEDGEEEAKFRGLIVDDWDADKIKKLKGPNLLLLIEAFELDVDGADFPKVKDLKVAVIAAIDNLFEDDSDEEEDETPDEKPKSKVKEEVSDDLDEEEELEDDEDEIFDLDGVDDEDEEEDDDVFDEDI